MKRSTGWLAGWLDRDRRHADKMWLTSVQTKARESDMQRDGSPNNDHDTLLNQAANKPELFMSLFEVASLSEFSKKWH